VRWLGTNESNPDEENSTLESCKPIGVGIQGVRHTARTGFLLQRNESGGVCGANTWTTVSHGLVRDGEFGKIMTRHFWLDFNGVEDLAVIDADNASDHLRYDNHVAEMGFDYCGFLIRECLLLCFAEFFDETHGFPLETTLEASTCTRVDELNKILVGKIKQLL